LPRQLQRLRQEGQQRLEAEEERLRTLMADEAAQEGQSPDAAGSEAGVSIKLRWSVQGVPGDNGGYSEDVLHRLFRKVRYASTV